MRLTIFGASGGTGTHLVRQALDHGHDVTAVVRDPSRLAVPAHERLRVVTADVTDPADIGPAVKGADAVLTTIGKRDPGPTTICADSGHSIIEAMGEAGVRRLLVVGAAGMVADAGDGPITRYVAKPILQRILRDSFADMHRCEDEVRATELDWTIVRPPRLLDKEPTGTYRTAYDISLRRGMTIARADLAACILGLLADRASVRRHVSVAY